MKKILAIMCLVMFVISCLPIHKCNSYEIMSPTENDLLLNETEGANLNKIFETGTHGKVVAVYL